MTATEASAASVWPIAILFDLDGTLADSFAAIAAALDHVLRLRGFAPRGVGWARRHVGRGAAALVHDALGPGGTEELEREVGEAFYERYRSTFVPETPPMPGALDVVRWAHELTGGRVGIVSNKAAALCKMWLDHHGFSPWVAAVSGPDASGARKPDPAAVKPVLEALRAEPASALLVGDMTVDVATGLGIGMRVVAVHGQTSTRVELERAGATFVLDDLRDLPGWVQRRPEDRA